MRKQPEKLSGFRDKSLLCRWLRTPAKSMMVTTGHNDENDATIRTIKKEKTLIVHIVTSFQPFFCPMLQKTLQMSWDG